MSILTKRDLTLFGDLGKYGMLTTSQVARRVFPGVQSSTLLRRLRALEKAKWIYRVNALESGELVWLLSRKGETEVGLDTSMVKPNRNGVEHDVLLVDLRHRLEGVGLGQNFMPEWTIRRQTYSSDRRRRDDFRLIPDGVFSAVRWDKKIQAIAIELELHAKNMSRYEKIFTRYQEQSDLDLVWYFVKSKSFGEGLVAKWRSTPEYRRRPDNHLVYTVLPDLEKNGRRALIHFMELTPNEIGEFFVLPKPAQPPAQPVGTPIEAIPESEPEEIAS